MRAAPVAASSGKPPTSLSSSGVPDAERGEGDAGLVGLAVGKHDEVGAREARGHLAVGDEPRDEADVRRGRTPQG